MLSGVLARAAVMIDSSTTVTADVGVRMLAEVVRVIILRATAIDLEFVVPLAYATDGTALLEEESLLFC